MAAIDRTDYALSGIMPVVPRFDFYDSVIAEVPAAWEAMEAMQDYEQNVRPIGIRAWADARGREIWNANKPWFCHL